MTLATTIVLLAAGFCSAVETIDDFSYTDAAAARKAWRASERGGTVDLRPDGGRSVVGVPAPFASNTAISRVAVDRAVQLNLSTVGGFELQVAIDPPDLAEHVTLYFRSGDGWFGASGHVTKAGWQTVRFSKASFGTEGTPGGWQKIDTIRLAFWRGAKADGVIRLRNLATVSHEVAIITMGNRKNKADSERKTAIACADRMADMLESLGLGNDGIDESSVAQGGLGRRKIAILPYNPGLPADTVDALAKFAERGGKLIVCYQLPGKLAAVLGVQSTRYVKPEGRGALAEMRFDGSLVGLPKAAKQDSWNATHAEPAPGAEVVGRWFDADGRPTGHNALLLNKNGAFFSHVLLGDDPDAKRQLMAALLGKLAPELWDTMARNAIDHAQLAGGFDDPAALRAFVAAAARPVAAARLAEAERLLADARVAAEAGRHPSAVALAGQSHEALVEAVLRATPSNDREGRAVWNHSGTGAYPGDWPRSAKLLADNGINMVLPNMLWGGLAHYPSKVLPVSDTCRKHGDQIEQCLSAARQQGLEVHVWKVNWNLSNAPKDFIARIRAEKRNIVSYRGEAHDWLCPSHPKNFELELASMLEVAKNYDVNGLHFDYIRYPGDEYCYCDGCRQRFEADSGSPVANWPDDCHRGQRQAEYRDWRCAQITRLVRAVYDQAKQLKPRIKISAAVFSSYPDCRKSVGQDWPLWAKNGWLDFVCPMDYTESDLAYRSMVGRQLDQIERKIPMYPGIGATASRSSLGADRVVGQALIARQVGANGFTIFDFNPGTAHHVIPGLGLGLGATKARPPHREP